MKKQQVEGGGDGKGREGNNILKQFENRFRIMLRGKGLGGVREAKRSSGKAAQSV